MFKGAGKKTREMDWQLVASYFTVKSTDILCSAPVFWPFLRMLVHQTDLTVHTHALSPFTPNVKCNYNEDKS